MVKQSIRGMGTFWSLPGGALENGESIKNAVARETLEETGVKVRAGRLLYVSERIIKRPKKHIVHIMLDCEYISGTPGVGHAPTASEKIIEASFIPLAKLEEYGISAKFAALIKAGFPHQGEYVPEIMDLGL